MNSPVHIIGAGVAGLGAAHALARQGVSSIVHEAGDHIGGRAACVHRDGRAFEIGGKNFSTGWPRFTALLREFGIEEFEPQHPGFHIVMRDQLVALDKKRTLTGDLRLARLLGLRGALQFNAFLTQARRNAPRLSYEGGLIEDVEKQWDWASASHHFAKPLADGPLRLFSIISGAAEPCEVAPSLLMMFAAGFGKGEHRALRGGVGRLHDALARGKTIRFGARVERIVVENGAVAGLEIVENGARRRTPAARVICALPLHAMRRLLPLPAYARVAADRIRYFPLALVNAVYDGPVFRDGVNSIMFAPGEPLGHCSANRIDQPHHVRFTLSGAAARDALDRPDHDLIDLAERTFSRRMPITRRRVDAHVARHDGGICAYGAFYTSARRDVLRAVEAIDGFEVAGDYLEGHTMEGCLTAADRAVERMIAQREQEGGSARAAA